MNKGGKRVMFLLFLAISILFTNCKNVETQQKENIPPFHSSVPIEEIESKEQEGNAYSELEQKEIVREIIEKSKPIVIDTFLELHSFRSDDFLPLETDTFSLELIKDYSQINKPVSEKQKKLLRVSDHFIDIGISEKFDSYIFY